MCVYACVCLCVCVCLCMCRFLPSSSSSSSSSSLPMLGPRGGGGGGGPSVTRHSVLYIPTDIHSLFVIKHSKRLLLLPLSASFIAFALNKTSSSPPANLLFLLQRILSSFPFWSEFKNHPFCLVSTIQNPPPPHGIFAVGR